jgi:DNA adenine methylase
MYIRTQTSSFQYLGGKYSYLPWLLPLLPTCKHFVDVFGGSGVVLLNRDPSMIETYNDVNKKLVNFFQVLRDQPEELISLLELTPHSKHEYDQAWYTDTDTPVEQARKFFIRTNQSIWAAGGQSQVKGWCASIRDTRVKMSEKTNKWLNAVNNLSAIVNRFKQVQLECRDFRFILSKYDTPDTLFYLDSPYDKTFRSNTPYEFDFVNQDFFDMQHFCRKAVGKVAVSGYDTPFMNELFFGFKKHIGPLRKNNRSEKKAIECLWTNYTI